VIVEKFNEYSETGREIMVHMEIFLISMSVKHSVHFKEPYHDIARRFLNEIREFEALTEVTE